MSAEKKHCAQVDSNGTTSNTNTTTEFESKDKNILVTGGAGYIGTHTCVELINSGFNVFIVDNLCNSSAKSLERVNEITGAPNKLHFFKVDLCDIVALEEVFKKIPTVHAVIHFAGLKAVGESTKIPLRYYDNNLTGTMNLLKLMEKYNSFNFIFSSSATVYGDAVSPIPETAGLAPTNAYGRTKFMIEEILRDVANGETGKNWRIVILRYFNPVGAHPSGKIGEDPKGIPNNLMPFICQVAVQTRPHLNVFGNDYDTRDGTGVRDYIHVVDLAKGHVAALTKGIYGQMSSNCESYNLGRGEGITVLELVEGMRKASQQPIPYQIVARRPGDVAVNYADSSKANKELGWKAELQIQRMCDDAWRWQSQNRKGFE